MLTNKCKFVGKLNVTILITEYCFGRKTSRANRKNTFEFRTISILTLPAKTIFDFFISCPKQTIFADGTI